MTTNITVIGAGPGGYVAALRAAQLGADVALIEEDHAGGTCLNRGCIPSKIMKAAADRLDDIGAAGDFGVLVKTDPSLDMNILTRRKEWIIETQREGIEALLRHHKVNMIRGKGRIAGAGRTLVTGKEGGEQEVSWDRLILATGSRPMSLPGLPFDGKEVISSDHALYLESVPASIAIVGGGVIGCEFACILSSFGSKVTLVEAMDRLLPLPSVDPDCSKVFQREMKKRKIAFHLNATVESAVPRNGEVSVTVGPSPFAHERGTHGSETFTLDVEKVLVSIGRIPNTQGIGIETVGVATDERGWIVADDGMRTNVENVYAIGDLLGPAKVMLAHVASAEGRVAAENAMGGRRKMTYERIPGAVFTRPEVADVGLTESQARETTGEIRTDTVLFRSVGKAQVLGEIAGLIKMISETETGRLLGVHMLGPHVTELIAEATLALNAGVTATQLAETIHAHPTLSEGMLEVSLKACDQALHG